jgi:hypothetical protein
MPLNLEPVRKSNLAAAGVDSFVVQRKLQPQLKFRNVFEFRVNRRFD